ncbi:C-X-C motif chemokine 16-like [Rhineura floridana]|uniref:C-X-C motif chemokine 16-like n=1 Tax=Rhineura floridana TaxID=261503 RepID=UPI002AC7F060|nr:C-X-C motif chemokine 16-like [Rhineura floridana]
MAAHATLPLCSRSFSLSSPFAFGRGSSRMAPQGLRAPTTSGRFSTKPRRIPLLLPPSLLVLLLAGQALGNEGGAAGACKCTRYIEQPWVLKEHPQRIQTWEPCMSLIKFTLRHQNICSLQDVDWVTALMKKYPGKRKGAGRPDAGMGRPTSTSRASLLAQTPTAPPRDTPDETTRGGQLAPESTTGAAWMSGSTRSPPQPGDGPGKASQSPQQAERGSPKAAVVSLLAVALASVVLAIGVVCRRRRRGRGGVLAAGRPLEDPAEENFCQPYREET